MKLGSLLLTAAGILSMSALMPTQAEAVELDQNQAVLAPPVNDVPRWYSIQSNGAPVVAYSLTTGQPVAQLPNGYKFLAFGSDGRVVTLGLSGQVVFVPALSASQLYPVADKGTEWKAAGPTLEEQAEIAKKKAKEAQAKGLEPAMLKKKQEENKAKTQQGQPGQQPAVGAGGAGKAMEI